MKINTQALGLISSCLLLALPGCATIVSGTQQSLFVDTPEVEGATCQLNDSKGGSWYLGNTPGSVSVAKGNGPMNVMCKKEKYKSASVSVEEEIAGATLGNVILGGGVGILVDAASGAAQKYPDRTIVWMEPVNWTSEAARTEWKSKKDAFEEAEAKAKAERESTNAAPHRNR
jgi:hypothetical protein